MRVRAGYPRKASERSKTGYLRLSASSARLNPVSRVRNRNQNTRHPNFTVRSANQAWNIYGKAWNMPPKFSVLDLTKVLARVLEFAASSPIAAHLPENLRIPP